MTLPGRSSAGGLVIDRLSIWRAGQPLVRTVSACIAAGEVLTIMGPSGSGKSTVLNALAGLLDPIFALDGSVTLNGRTLDGLPPEQRRLGLLFQDDLLFPHLDVAGNLAFGLRQGGSRTQRRQVIDAALADAGLGGFGPRDPATLSGGQRARVSLLRTLLSDPEALLLDEPFSRLDASLRASFRRFVFDHARARGLPTLLVTHDAEDAAAAAGPTIRLGAPVDEHGG